MFDQLPRDKRNTAGRVDLFAFDDLHRFHRVPLVQEYHLVAAMNRWHHGCGTGGAMEHGYDCQANPDGRLGQFISPTQGSNCRGIAGGNRVGCQVAMATERALGLSGRATGIENRRRVIRCNIDRGQVLIRKSAIIIGSSDNRFQRPGRRGQFAWATGHYDMFEVGQVRQMRRNPVPAFGVAEQDAGL